MLTLQENEVVEAYAFIIEKGLFKFFEKSQEDQENFFAVKPIPQIFKRFAGQA